MKTIPQPKKIGTVPGGVGIAVCTVAACEELLPALHPFAEHAGRAFGIKPQVMTGDGDIVLINDPSLGEDAYRVVAENGRVAVYTSGLPGANRGLAKIFQLMRAENGELLLPGVLIWDRPDSSWRGLMLDLARQWHPVSYLYDYIDMLWVYGMSVFQLHFTDNESFTLPSVIFPKLSTPGRHYTRDEIASIAEYAHARGIKIVPEIDAPGHCRPFNEAYPEIFGSNGIIEATDEAFDALEKLYDELISFFPYSDAIHIGGDEAQISKWNESPESLAWRDSHGLKDERDLYGEYIRRLTGMILSKGKIPVVWEGFPKSWNGKIDKRVLVFSWENHYQTAPELLDGGFDVINAAWRPLYVVAPSPHWEQDEVFAWNVNFWNHWWDASAARGGLSVPMTSRILGGQICAWGDNLAKMDYAEGDRIEFEIVRRLVPALAEKTWNHDSGTDYESFCKVFEKTDRFVVKR